MGPREGVVSVGGRTRARRARPCVSPVWLGATLLVILAQVSQSAPAAASHVVIPTDFPTIEAGLQSKADTIFVGWCHFDDELVIRRAVVLLPSPPPDPWLPPTVPEIGKLTVDRVNGQFGNDDFVLIRGFWIQRPARVLTADLQFTLNIESCRMDSGLVQVGQDSGGGGTITVQQCTIFGAVFFNYNAVNFFLNTVIGGGVSVHSLGYHIIHGNYVQGASGPGIFSSNYGYPGWASNNTVVGCDVGIASDSGGQFFDNLITDCIHDGFQDQGGDHRMSLHVFRNRVLRCGGNGFSVGVIAGSSLTTLNDNYIERPGISGIRCRGGDLYLEGNTVISAASHGVEGGAEDARVAAHNRIYGSGGDGIHLATASDVSWNIVGRSRGHGIYVERARGPVSHNTSYSNEGHGLFISDDGDLPIAIDHNIAFQNGGYGRYGAFSADASCNDWFGNVLGVAYPMGPTDLQVDPMFCDVAHDSVTLSAQSPLVDPVGCGLIGALGVGCGVVGLESEPRSVALAVRWAGASGRAAVTLPNGTPATLEVIDVQGRKISGVRLSGLGAGPHEVELGRGLRSGVYFARLSQGHDVAVAKGVVLR